MQQIGGFLPLTGAAGKAIGDVSALVLPDQPIMAHSGASSPTTGRPSNMAQPAANGTSLFNGTDASTAPLRYAPRAGCTPVMRMQPAKADAASARLDFEDRAEFNATKALRPI